jgi:hypothetical protein
MKKIFSWLNGKKRSIGIIGLSVCSLKLAENNINVDILEAGKLLFSIIGGIGVAHADLKSDKSLIKKFSGKK